MTYIRIARKIGFPELNNELFELDDTKLNFKFQCLNDEPEDEIFEFQEQHNEFRELISQGFELVVQNSHQVMADDISFDRIMTPAPSVCDIQCGAAARTQRKPPVLLDHTEVKSQNSAPEVKTLSFGGLMGYLSPEAQAKLRKENAGHERVMARLTNAQISSFNFSPQDKQIVMCLAQQCRVHEYRAQQNPELTKQPLRMPDNLITARLPIRTKITLKALKKNGLLSPTALYLSAPLEQVHAIFEKFPSIPAADRQNILTGMAMARYARAHSTGRK